MLLGLFKQAPEETGDSSRQTSPGTSLFLVLLFHHMTFAPVLGSSWGGKGGRAPPSCCGPESSGSQLSPFFTLLYSNQTLLSRVCFLFLLIFVYKTRGSHQSPQPQSARPPLWHSPVSLPLLAGAMLPHFWVVFQSPFCNGKRNTLPQAWGILFSWVGRALRSASADSSPLFVA